MSDFKQNKFYQASNTNRTGKSVVFGLLSLTALVLITMFLFKIYERRTSTAKLPILKGVSDIPGDKYKTTLTRQYYPDKEWQFLTSTWADAQPQTVAQSALLVNIGTGEALYNKLPDEKLKIASLTKIMTAIVVLEHNNLTDTAVVSGKADSTGENSMGITAGETYTIEELLYGLILNSGNDAAIALAEATAGDVETFVDWMNIKSKELALTNTYFADPSGLNDNTYSTATDLVRLTRYALKFPELRQIVATVTYALPATEQHKYIPLENQTNLLTTYPGVKGFKTGYTEEAGMCLVTYAENNGIEVVGVVLNSNDRKGDMSLMLDHGFGKYGIRVEHPYKLN